MLCASTAFAVTGYGDDALRQFATQVRAAGHCPPTGCRNVASRSVGGSPSLQLRSRGVLRLLGNRPGWISVPSTCTRHSTLCFRNSTSGPPTSRPYRSIAMAQATFWLRHTQWNGPFQHGSAPAMSWPRQVSWRSYAKGPLLAAIMVESLESWELPLVSLWRHSTRQRNFRWQRSQSTPVWGTHGLKGWVVLALQRACRVTLPQLRDAAPVAWLLPLRGDCRQICGPEPRNIFHRRQLQSSLPSITPRLPSTG